MFVGVDGITREVKSIFACCESAVRGIQKGLCGIDGVDRVLLSRKIVRIEARPDTFFIVRVDSNGIAHEDEVFSTDPAQMGAYGFTQTNSGTMMRLTAATVGYHAIMNYKLYVVFDDGTVESIYTVLSSNIASSFVVQVKSYVYANNCNCLYYMSFLGHSFIQNGFSGSATETSVLDYKDTKVGGAKLHLGKVSGSGSTYEYLNVTSCTVDGVEVPFKFV